MLSKENVLKKLGISSDQVSLMSEYENYYYVKPKSEYEYDSLMWRIDKNTGVKEFFDQIDYISNSINGRSLGEVANILILN